MAVVAIGIGIGLFALRVLTEKPCPTVDHDHEAYRVMVASQPANGENGWDAIEKATEMRLDADERAIARVLGEEELARARDQRATRSAPWYESAIRTRAEKERYPDPEDSEKYHRLGEEAFAECHAAGVIGVVAAAHDAPRFVPPYVRPGSGPGSVLPMTQAVALIKLARSEMRRAHLAGEEDRGMIALRGAVTVRRAMSAQRGFLDTVSVVLATPAIAEEVRREALDRPLKVGNAREALRLIGELDDPALGDRVVASLSWAMRDVIQRSYTRGDDGDGRFVPSAYARMMPYGFDDLPGFAQDPDRWWFDFVGCVMPSRRWAEREVARQEELFGRYLRARLSERPMILDPDAFEDSLPGTARLLGWTAVSMSHLALQIDQMRVEVRGALIVVALQVYRAERGEYPATLAELTPGILARVPEDPFAPDGAFRYRRDGESFLLYSVGFDGTDDCGRPAEDWEGNALEKYGPGTDYVLSRREDLE